jgi:hypothetical protein
MPMTVGKRNKKRIFKWYEKKKKDNRMWGAFEKSLVKIEEAALVRYFR